MSTPKSPRRSTGQQGSQTALPLPSFSYPTSSTESERWRGKEAGREEGREEFRKKDKGGRGKSEQGKK